MVARRRALLEVDFNQLTSDMAGQGLDVYDIKYPKLKIDNDIGEQLRRHFLLLQCLQTGLAKDEAIAFATKDTDYDFEKQNTGRHFNFWHFVLDLMKKNSKAQHPRTGKCVIKRGMVDPNEQEDLTQVFCYPYIAQGGRFAAPVIDKILDFYGVDALRITTKFGD